MNFNDKLKKLRKNAKLSQKDLAKLIGVSERTVQNYEAGSRFPRTTEISHKICEVFGISSEELFSKEDTFVIEAVQKEGSASGKDVQKLISEVSGLFAGGELKEEDKDAVMQAIMDAYWVAKKENRKYAPNKSKDEN